MLPIDSYLRRLPAGLDQYERLIFDNLITSSDLASFALGRLEAAATALDTSAPAESTRALKIGMLSDAWTVIDAIHTSRLLLNALGGEQIAVLAEEYLVLTEAARTMRNDMDHLPQKLGNFSKRLGVFQPLYGSVRYVRATGNGEREIITLPFSPPVGQWAALVLTPEIMQGEGVASIYLEAFGHDFPLKPACASLEVLLEQIALFIEPKLTAGLAAAANGDQEALKNALTPLRLDMIIRLNFPSQAGAVTGDQ